MAKVTNDFGTQVKELRERLHLTQEAMAEVLGVSFATVNRWENGWTAPSKLALRQIDELCEEHNFPPLYARKEEVSVIGSSVTPNRFVRRQMHEDVSNDIRERLAKCWRSDTSSDPDHWEQANPAWGQCAVTACLVQDILGGDILWTMAICPDGREYSHYFNMLPKCVVFDATRQQFPKGTLFVPVGGIPRTQSGAGKDFGSTREYVLSYQATLDRYVRLKQRFQSLFG